MGWTKFGDGIIHSTVSRIWVSNKISLHANSKEACICFGKEQPLDGAVKLSISQFEPWIKNSNLPFFPEYTKHDIDHIEAVLRTAVGLIRDDSWGSVTPADAAVLILAVLLHDCAMHLSEDGFFSLLEPDRCNKSVVGMADKPWNVLWEDFIVRLHDSMGVS